MKHQKNQPKNVNLSGVALQGFQLEPPTDFSEVPEVQESTLQIPYGENRIFDPKFKVPGFQRAVYLKILEHGCWNTGQSRYLPLRFLARELGVKSHSQVLRAIKQLTQKGWIQVLDKRESDGCHRYQIIHYQNETPVDTDGRPRQCAVPTGKGSVFRLVAEGKITWEIALDWLIRKIASCWQSGFLAMTVRDACKLIPFGYKKLKENMYGAHGGDRVSQEVIGEVATLPIPTLSQTLSEAAQAHSRDIFTRNEAERLLDL